MNIRNQLLLEHSKANTKLIVRYIGLNKERLVTLMDCFFCNEYRVSQRSAMAVSHFFDQQPILMKPYLEKLILNLENEEISVAIKRNTVRILQFMEIPEHFTASLFDTCLSFLIDKNEPIAVKAFSMTVLYNICKKYPELKVEVIPVLELLLNQTDSLGIKSRGKKELLRLSKI